MSPRRLAANCSVVNCPSAATYRGKCEPHAKQANRQHNERYANVYDAAHVRLRADYQRRMDAGETFTCWRCAAAGRPHVVDPKSWDLGHEGGVHRGPECVKGNRGATRRGGG